MIGRTIEFWYLKTKNEVREADRKFELEQKFLDVFHWIPDEVFFKDEKAIAIATIEISDNLEILNRKITKMVFRVEESVWKEETNWKMYKYKDCYIWERLDKGFKYIVEIWFK